jgi:hypothetical protein
MDARATTLRVLGLHADAEDEEIIAAYKRLSALWCVGCMVLCVYGMRGLCARVCVRVCVRACVCVYLGGGGGGGGGERVWFF